MHSKDMLSALDLFCGGGGMSLGVSSRFNVVGAADIEEDCIDVLAQNQPGVDARVVDLSCSASTREFLLRFPRVQLICGGPPCQDFSNSGRHVEAARSELLVRFAEIVVEARPEIAVTENVPYMVRTDAFRRYCDILSQAGYNMLILFANAAACNVAQDRRRVFVFATFAKKATLQAILAEYATLDTIPSDVSSMASCLENEHEFVWYCARNRWQPCVYSSARLSPTLRTNCVTKKPAHYEGRHDDDGNYANAHVPTVQELSRMSSFPSSYFDGVSPKSASRMIGNAVPPNVASVVAEICVKLLCSPPKTSNDTTVVGIPRPYGNKKSKIDRLLEMSMSDYMDVCNEKVQYVCGSSQQADQALEEVLGWIPKSGWRVVLKRRRTTRTNKDDLYVFIPGYRTEFRSLKQILRVTNVPIDQFKSTRKL